MSTDPASQPTARAQETTATETTAERRESISQRSEDSQTAAEFIRDQMQLEADAREALPYVCLDHVILFSIKHGRANMSFSISEHRELHQTPRFFATEYFRLLDL